MSNIMIAIAAFLISAVIFSIVGYYVRKKVAESKIGSAEEEKTYVVVAIYYAKG